MLQNKILKFIRPIRAKMYLSGILSTIGIILMYSGLVMLILSIMSHIVTIVYVERWLLLALGIGIVVGILWGLMMYPNTDLVLKSMDHLGYDERFMTAWEFRDSDADEILLQRQDCLDMMARDDHRKLFKTKVPYKRFLKGFVMLALSFALLFIPSEPRDTAKDQEEALETILAEEEELKAITDEILKDKVVPDELEMEYAKLLEELSDKLKEAKSEEEAIKALSIAKDELKKLDMNALKKELAKLKEHLESLEEKEMNEMSEEEMSEALEQLEEALKALEESELKTEEQVALEEALEALKEAMAENDSEASTEALESASELAADALEALESSGELSASMQAAINEAGKALSSNPTISELAFSSSESSDSTSQATASQSSEASSASQSSGSPSSQGSGEGEGDGQGDGNGSGEGSGTGTGQGAGTGQGQGAGSGQGQGTTNEDAGYQEEGSGSSGGWVEGEDKEGSYEALYPPSHLGGESEPTFVTGDRQDGGDSQVQQVEGAPAITGDLVNYKQLYTEYNEQAMSSVEDMDIPVLMKDLVRDYFTSLE